MFSFLWIHSVSETLNLQYETFKHKMATVQVQQKELKWKASGGFLPLRLIKQQHLAVGISRIRTGLKRIRS